MRWARVDDMGGNDDAEESNGASPICGEQTPHDAPAAHNMAPTESADVLIARGKALVQQQNYAAAIPLLERATQLAPDSFDAWSNLGFALVQEQRPADGVAAYD